MHSFITPLIALATLSAIPAVTAHGWVSGIVVNGKSYPGGDPRWSNPAGIGGGKTPRPVWYAMNNGQQNLVFSEEVNQPDISCHHQATPGSTYVNVNPGDTMEIQWATPEGGPWRTSHQGPVIDYMASCNGDCTRTTGDQLNFFKIAEAGMYQSPHTPGAGTFGKWATDTVRDNRNTWKVTIPQGLSGPHVLRTEIFALMGAGNLGHAQMYPQCINLNIAGSGGSDPCASGADCRRGPELYKETDPGIYISIHKGISNYQIPGPALWQGAGRAMNKVKRAFSA